MKITCYKNTFLFFPSAISCSLHWVTARNDYYTDRKLKHYRLRTVYIKNRLSHESARLEQKMFHQGPWKLSFTTGRNNEMLSYLRNQRILWLKTEERNDLSYQGKGNYGKGQGKVSQEVSQIVSPIFFSICSLQCHKENGRMAVQGPAQTISLLWASPCEAPTAFIF